ncbi:hypothetical protein F0L74_00610 [Chitinophaga agrisoli]|uniref:Uncharacterized protein n=1 Tax=Chitinophaga agrisoli TaxID=2607653 RepID=A0A5B2W086_9BACT|nr:hypothetical protein [Chitinophaga agrisoli]KAA2244514.1 hypothetical protein F0L74_00610 [Chitinophaga agrisoli]
MAPPFIYSSDPGLIIGFHGCDQEVRDNIVFGHSSLRPSKNKWDWLGGGMYFWQNNYERALQYATDPPTKSAIKTPAVLGVIFNLGHCLDLTDKEGIDLVKLSYDTLSKSAKQVQKALPHNSNPKENPDSKDKIIRRLDCAVINNIHSLLEKNNEAPFESVRAVFFEGEEVYEMQASWTKPMFRSVLEIPILLKHSLFPAEQLSGYDNNTAQVRKVSIPFLGNVSKLPAKENVSQISRYKPAQQKRISQINSKNTHT